MPQARSAPAPAVRRCDRAQHARAASGQALLASDKPHLAASLMRINHTGEVCAQALCAGQAPTAQLPEVRAKMEQAAAEEVDHLRWCTERLDALEARPPSLLNPFWYAGSFAIGTIAGAAGDRWSLGFVEATERQVEAHLNSYLEPELGGLPEQDARSGAVVEPMKVDEAQHAELARKAGAATRPDRSGHGPHCQRDEVRRLSNLNYRPGAGRPARA